MSNKGKPKKTLKSEKGTNEKETESAYPIKIIKNAPLVFPCDYCNKVFTSKVGVSVHMRKCANQDKKVKNIFDDNSDTEPTEESNNNEDQEMILNNLNDIVIEQEEPEENLEPCETVTEELVYEMFQHNELIDLGENVVINEVYIDGTTENTDGPFFQITRQEMSDIIIEDITEKSNGDRDVVILSTCEIPQQVVNITPVSPGATTQTPEIQKYPMIDIIPISNSNAATSSKPVPAKKQNTENKDPQKKFVEKATFSALRKITKHEPNEEADVYEYVADEVDMESEETKARLERTCKRCNVEFPDPIQLLKHNRVMHKRERIRMGMKELSVYFDYPVEDHCPVCKCEIRTGGYRVNFIKHLHVHLDQPLYTCSICESKFRRKDHMLVHKRRHIVK